MATQQYSEKTILKILAEAKKGQRVVDLCDKYGMSASSFYTWRTRYNPKLLKQKPPAKATRAHAGTVKKRTPIRVATARLPATHIARAPTATHRLSAAEQAALEKRLHVLQKENARLRKVCTNLRRDAAQIRAALM